VVATVGTLVALGILIVPLDTFLWTSPDGLRGLYMWFAAGTLALAIPTLGFVYAKRLQDQNLNGLWALLILLGIPLTTQLVGLSALGHLYAVKNTVAYSAVEALMNAALIAWGAIVLVIALRAPRGGAERFGPRTEASGVLQIRHPMVVLALMVAAVVAPLTVYAGFVQDGLWVGREEYSVYRGPSITPPGGGEVLARCGNAKGVSAQAEYGPEGGFNRDAFGGTWSLVVLPDGSLDIQTYSDTQVLSYREDGFTITATGVRLNALGMLEKDVNRFQVVARVTPSDGSPWSVENITVMTFVRREFDYTALISVARLVGDGSDLPHKAARAFGVLVMADCWVSQEYDPKAER
jgi:uncharacterized membrane protein YhaH (DUF805 family)